jgi:O-acetyl-ADP-ribose deacetylase (regulator of RNase III)
VIEVRVEDLAFYSGDAIVRPATAILGATTPLLRRLELAAGKALLDQLALSEPLAVGSAVVTGAGDLPVDLLVHVIVSSTTERVTRDGVRRALRSALQRVLAWQIAEVAIPPFGLGAGNLDIDESAHLMADELARHRSTSAFPTRVTLVAETPDEAHALEIAIARSIA